MRMLKSMIGAICKGMESMKDNSRGAYMRELNRRMESRK